MDVKNLNIAIVGAGYGGAAAAKALSLLGATVNVYEQAGEIHEVGAGIGLRPSTLDCFRQWGILEEIEKVTSPSDCFEIVTATGDPIAKEVWPEIDTYGLTTRFVHRGDFIDTLLSVLPEGMVHLDHRLETITDNGDSATLTFANGTQVSADLVIGADGIKSVVRQQLFSDQQPVFAGEHAYRVVISADGLHGLDYNDSLRMYIGRGTKIYFLPLRHRNQLSFDVTALNPDPTWAPPMTRDDLLKTLEGFDQRLIDIARDLDMDTVNIRAVYDIDPVDVWHSDSVALLGDAAHAMCHHQGQGANSAIMDARVLADTLRDAESLPDALAAYQAARKPVTDELQRISRNSWTEEELDEVFPGQKPATVEA